MNWVYGFQCQEFIKIGVAQNVAFRRKQFQLGNPLPIKIVTRIKIPDGAYDLERRIHELLVEFRVGREWFQTTPEVVRVAIEQAKIDLGAAPDGFGGWILHVHDLVGRRATAKAMQRVVQLAAKRGINVSVVWGPDGDSAHDDS